jgi:hypothetical protein
MELVIEHKPGPVGFRADFNFGDTAKAVNPAVRILTSSSSRPISPIADRVAPRWMRGNL